MLRTPAVFALLLALALPIGAVAQSGGEVPLPRERPSATESGWADGALAGPELPRARPEPIAGGSGETSAEPPPEDMAEPSAEENAPIDPPVDPPADPPVEEPVAPAREYQVACPAVLNGEVTASALPPIHEDMCGLQSPLSLEAVTANGRSVPLNTPVTTDCGMATAMPRWIADVDRWLQANENTRIATVNVGTHYACRNVNNAREGNLSFHAFGDALDVTGFTLEDGRTITVEAAWPGTVEEGSRIIRFAHDAACTHFTTVLGPEADALHHDHLHIDLGCHGQRCTARLCQ
jgi:hypothetical protein